MKDMPEIHKLYLEEMGLEKKDIPRGVWNCLNVIDTILCERKVKLSKTS